MTEPIVSGMSPSQSGGLDIAVRPGFELLGKYLESDFRGLVAGPFPDVRALLVRALEGGDGGDVVSDGYALTVEDGETTISLLTNESRTATFATEDVLQALDEYAKHLAARA